MAEEVLRATNICKSFGGVQALRGAEFSLRRGEVHALMGENGAGKSTFAKIIAGVTKPESGTLSIEGKERASYSPSAAQAEGVSIVHQELDLFPDLSIAENIVIGNRSFAEGTLARRSRMESFAAQSLARVGLQVPPRRRVSALNIGDMQLVVIARALSMQSRILILDEPTSSLFHDSAERLFELIARLRAQAVAIVYVSHKMDEIFRVCDRMTVLRDGVTVATPQKEETTARELISFMVGREWQPSAIVPPLLESSEPALVASGLRTRKLSDVSFTLLKGEVLGIAGLVGSGRSTLGRALAGMEPLQSGRLSFNSSTGNVSLLPEDRKLDGLMMQMNIRENGSIAALPKLARLGVTDPPRETQALQPVFTRVRLKSGSLGDVVSSLSGGNQQKVLLARCLLGDPDILFLDDPTRGVDVGAKEDIYAVIAELARRGKAILFVSSELPELLRCCGRILVMRNGRLSAALDAKTTTQEEIMLHATNPVDASGAPCLN